MVYFTLFTTFSMKLSIIVAMDENQLIGNNNALPWHLPADLQYFKQTTSGKTVLMGRKTYDSIGRPLPNRRNIVISRNPDFQAPGIETASNIDAALALAKNDAEIMIIGGASFYQQTLQNAHRIYITEVKGSFKGDAHFPKFNRADFIETSRESHAADEKNNSAYDFVVLDRKQL